MKKIIIPSVIQFLIVFLIIGGIAYFVRGDFFSVFSTDFWLGSRAIALSIKLCSQGFAPRII